MDDGKIHTNACFNLIYCAKRKIHKSAKNFFSGTPRIICPLVAYNATAISLQKIRKRRRPSTNRNVKFSAPKSYFRFKKNEGFK